MSTPFLVIAILTAVYGMMRAHSWWESVRQWCVWLCLSSLELLWQALSQFHGFEWGILYTWYWAWTLMFGETQYGEGTVEEAAPPGQLPITEFHVTLP